MRTTMTAPTTTTLRASALVFSSIWGGMTLLLIANGILNSTPTLLRLGMLALLAVVAAFGAIFEKFGLIYLSVAAGFVPLGYYLIGSPLFWPIGVSIIGVLVSAVALHILRGRVGRAAPVSSEHGR